ncbi:FeoB-associated Cys-rich membrane protein [Eubacterium oxidoreducens]|uniref:Copper chaperone CopZ n=1 Tax=Eubacterium oxidoreducens TaxID=1732 RepID=A0A1G6BN35_EUBOX|nr:FeoB-associated Cys-rich membrane protein [Eubacterium oxidoreducens]SDB21989.1 Copper chaperone CopZ [Eubacterium oxidoreducens]
MGEIIAWAVVIALVAVCIRALVKSHKSGTCAGCSSCEGGCSHCAHSTNNLASHNGEHKSMIKNTVQVDGMMCSMCEAHVAEAIRKAVPQAKKVKAKHRKGLVTFSTEEQVEESVIRDAIAQIGYDYKGFFAK